MRTPNRRRKNIKTQELEKEQPTTIPVIEMELTNTDLESQIEDDWLPSSYTIGSISSLSEKTETGVLMTDNTSIKLNDELVAGTEDIDFNFEERKYIHELSNYIEGTYQEHYSNGKTSAFQEIVDGGFGTGFCFGNIIKYSKRYGKKDGFNRKDILKIAHYAILALYAHDHDNVDY